MSNGKSLTLCGAALAGLLPPGWQRLSSESLGAHLAPGVVYALEQTATVAHYTQEHHNAVFDGLRALRSPK